MLLEYSSCVGDQKRQVVLNVNGVLIQFPDSLCDDAIYQSIGSHVRHHHLRNSSDDKSN